MYKIETSTTKCGRQSRHENIDDEKLENATESFSSGRRDKWIFMIIGHFIDDHNFISVLK